MSTRISECFRLRNQGEIKISEDELLGSGLGSTEDSSIRPDWGLH